MKAILIDKEVVLHGLTHIELVINYMNGLGLTHDEMDKMIEEGRVEFGSVFLNAKTGELEWMGDEARTSVYGSLDAMIHINGRPPNWAKKN